MRHCTDILSSHFWSALGQSTGNVLQMRTAKPTNQTKEKHIKLFNKGQKAKASSFLFYRKATWWEHPLVKRRKGRTADTYCKVKFWLPNWWLCPYWLKINFRFAVVEMATLFPCEQLNKEEQGRGEGGVEGRHNKPFQTQNLNWNFSPIHALFDYQCLNI